MTILAVDQGTTSTRALAVKADGSATITSAVRHKQYYPQSGWVEHDPLELIRNVESAIASSEDVSAIGIANQGESCLAWDSETLEPVSQIIVWQDNRTGEIVKQLDQSGAGDEVMIRAGLPLDSYFSASKFAWIIDKVPEAKRLLNKGKLRLGTTDAYFLDRLAGVFKTDVTTASRTSLMNLETGQWDETLCELFEVPIDALPEIVSTTGMLGIVNRGGNRIPVRASVVDQQASLYGHDCREIGDAKVTFGTGAFALTVTGDKALRAPHQGLLPTVAWQIQDKRTIYALDGGVYSAGSAIEWAKSLGLFEDYSTLDSFEQSAAIDRDLVFVPALAGLACPHWDRFAAGLWIGLSQDTDRNSMMQSILEGIAFRTAEVIRAMSSLTNIGDEISVDGGISVNPYFCQFLSDILNKCLTVKSFPEITALGTAQLAGADIVHVNQVNTRIQRYTPSLVDDERVEKFADAVARCSNWRTLS